MEMIIKANRPQPNNKPFAMLLFFTNYRIKLNPITDTCLKALLKNDNTTVSTIYNNGQQLLAHSSGEASTPSHLRHLHELHQVTTFIFTATYYLNPISLP